MCKMQLDREISWNPIMFRAMTLSARLQDLHNQKNTVSFLPKVQLLKLQCCSGLEWSAHLPGLGCKLHVECWASTQALGKCPVCKKQNNNHKAPARLSFLPVSTHHLYLSVLIILQTKAGMLGLPTHLMSLSRGQHLSRFWYTLSSLDTACESF